jgi:hypothetical protein
MNRLYMLQYIQLPADRMTGENIVEEIVRKSYCPQKLCHNIDIYIYCIYVYLYICQIHKAPYR